MKTVKIVFLLMLAFCWTAKAESTDKEVKTFVYHATLHCESCKAKVEKNIPFEKGVKDLNVNLEKQTVTIKFRTDKNTPEKLQKAIEKLNIPVSGFEEEKTTPGDGGRGYFQKKDKKEPFNDL